MTAAGYGRVLMISSLSAVSGNFGQANYSAAKGAVTTLTQSLALEGFRDGVLCNAIATGGLTRMTEGMGTHDELLPEHTALGVAMLCHESCTETAGLFRVEGGRIFKLRWQASEGREFVPPAADDPPEATAQVMEEISSQWAEIVDFNDGGAWFPQAERQARWLSPKL